MEVVVALALLGLLLALAVPRLLGAIHDRKVVGAAEEIVQVVRYAQQQAVADTVDSCEYQAVIYADRAEALKRSGTRDPSTGGCGTNPTPITTRVKRSETFREGVTAAPAPTTLTFIGAGRLPYGITSIVSITVAADGRSRTITIEPATGRVQITP